MEFGLFIPQANNGWIISENSPQYLPSFDLNRHTCREGEKYGFDFALSMVKMRGWGGPTEFWDYGLDPFTLCAGLAAETEKIRIIPSVALPMVHPAIAARAMVTIEQIAGPGRVGINIVSGWNKPEYEQYNLWPGDEYYKSRYEYSHEYVSILRGFWENGRLTHEGRVFKLDDALVQPQPQAPIQVVCAGQSDGGIRFTAEKGDKNFIVGEKDKINELNAKLKGFAREFGREDEVGSYAVFTVVMGDTDAEAQALSQHFTDGADRVALTNLQGPLEEDSGSGGGTGTAILRNAMYMGIPQVIGSYQTIADYFNDIIENTGLDGIMLTFPDFRDDVTRFGQNVMPLINRQDALVGSAG
jgi:pyrimidine oxygenase